MSFIRLPDPHPGRCENTRTVNHPDGAIETLRCLDYEHTEHVCTFPAPRHDGSASSSTWGGQTYTPPKPKPWVKPGDESS